MKIKQGNHFIYYLIIISTLIRCLLAMNIELGNDEVYYWTYALHLQTSYFDHPPLVAVFIRLFTFNLHFNQEIFVRLTAIIGSAFNTWLIYKLMLCIKNKQAAIYAAFMYTSCVYTSIISGLFILPDSPQVVFWLLTIYLLVHVFILEKNKILCILLAGLTIGLCTLCKVHGLYLWFAAFAYIFLFDRQWLYNKYLWVSVLITCTVIAPVFLWNYQNDFISYAYQSQRIVANNGIDIFSFLTEVIGEILYANPVNYLFIVIVLVVTIRQKLFLINKKLYGLLLLLSLPLIFIFWSISLFRDTLPHWPGPGYIALIILTAYYADPVFTARKKTLNILYAANALLFTAVIAGYTCINYLPKEFGSNDKADKGAGDFTLDLSGWQNFADQFAQIHLQDINAGNMRKDAVMLSNKWFPAAHLDYYVAHPLNIKLYAFGPLFDIHNMAWLNEVNGSIKTGDDAYYIAPSNYNSDPNKQFAKYFKTIEAPVTIPQYRSGVQVRQFYLYRMKYYEGGLNAFYP